MVKNLTFIFIFIIGLLSTTIAQNKCDDTISLFITYGELPMFSRESPGIEKLLKFVAENIEYPQTAIKDKVKGEVFVRFWIDTVGFTSEHEVVKGIREDLDNEALRIAKLIKFDEPAKSRGKPDGTCFALPISFSLPEKIKHSRKSR